jgi:hypothetical protein
MSRLGVTGTFVHGNYSAQTRITMVTVMMVVMVVMTARQLKKIDSRSSCIFIPLLP